VSHQMGGVIVKANIAPNHLWLEDTQALNLFEF
jgi:hypothetical protein